MVALSLQHGQKVFILLLLSVTATVFVSTSMYLVQRYQPTSSSSNILADIQQHNVTKSQTNKASEHKTTTEEPQQLSLLIDGIQTTFGQAAVTTEIPSVPSSSPIPQPGEKTSTVSMKQTEGSNNTTAEIKQQALTACNDQHMQDLELFITLPPDNAALAEFTLTLLPTLMLFWPKSLLRLLVLTDGEAKTLANFTEQFWQEIKTRELENNVRLEVNYSPIPYEDIFPKSIYFPPGWHRQQWLMHWADNFTTAKYVGFIDSDSFFVTRVTPYDLFVDDRPIVRALYGKPHELQTWWRKSTEATLKAIGRKEPFSCMTYFPIVFKTEHLAQMREHIRLQIGKPTFDESYLQIQLMNEYSQFCIMCAYLWWYQRGSYYWVVNEREPGFKGLIGEGQISSPEEGEIGPEIFARQRIHIAIHWGHTSPSFKPDQVLKAGVCYSIPDSNPLRPQYCKMSRSIGDRLSTINPYEWEFEGNNQASINASRALATHIERLQYIGNHCQSHPWDEATISDIFKYNQDDSQYIQNKVPSMPGSFAQINQFGSKFQPLSATILRKQTKFLL